jgi:hypothetical protein
MAAVAGSSGITIEGQEWKQRRGNSSREITGRSRRTGVVRGAGVEAVKGVGGVGGQE